MKNRATLWYGGILLAASLVLSACGAKQASISAELSDFKFTPSAWEVPAGAEVTLALTNTSSLEHEWVLFEKGYEVTLPFDDDDEGHILWEGEVEAGGSETFTFTAPTEPGVYQVTCGLAGHAEGGMIGTLTVR